MQYGNYINQIKPVNTYNDLLSEIKSILEESINWKSLLRLDFLNEDVNKYIKAEFKKGSCDCKKRPITSEQFRDLIFDNFFTYRTREDFYLVIFKILKDRSIVQPITEYDKKLYEQARIVNDRNGKFNKINK